MPPDRSILPDARQHFGSNASVYHKAGCATADSNLTVCPCGQLARCRKVLGLRRPKSLPSAPRTRATRRTGVYSLGSGSVRCLVWRRPIQRQRARTPGNPSSFWNCSYARAMQGLCLFFFDDPCLMIDFEWLMDNAFPFPTANPGMVTCGRTPKPR